MALLNLDPAEVAVFAFGLALAWMVVQLIKSRQAPRGGRVPATSARNWLPAAIALALLAAVWAYF